MVTATATGTTPNVAYTYSAYGTTVSTTGSLVQPYRYGSGYTDAATGLIKTGIRYYDPVRGRFTQQDPTRQEQHPYLYSKGCPNTYGDPTGAISIGGCAEEIAVGTFATAATGGVAGLLGGPFSEFTVPGGIFGGAVLGFTAGSVTCATKAVFENLLGIK